MCPISSSQDKNLAAPTRSNDVGPPPPVPPPKPPRAARLSARYQRVSNGRAPSFLRPPRTPITGLRCSSLPLEDTGHRYSAPSCPPDSTDLRFASMPVDSADNEGRFTSSSASPLPLGCVSRQGLISLASDSTRFMSSFYKLPVDGTDEKDGAPSAPDDGIDLGDSVSSPWANAIDRPDFASMSVDGGDAATVDVDAEDVFQNCMTDADSDWDSDSANGRISASWMTLEEVCDPDPDRDLSESWTITENISEPNATLNPYLYSDPDSSENCNLLCNLIDPEPNSCYSDSLNDRSSDTLEEICDSNVESDLPPKPVLDPDLTINLKCDPDSPSGSTSRGHSLDGISNLDSKDGPDESEEVSDSDTVTNPEPDPDLTSEPSSSEMTLEVISTGDPASCCQLSTSGLNLKQVFDPDSGVSLRCLLTSIHSELHPVHPALHEMLLMWRFYNRKTRQDRQDRQDRQVIALLLCWHNCHLLR